MSLFDPAATAMLESSFFARPTTLVARELLGCVLVSRIGGALTAGVVVETEAYLGSDDPGSHAATRGITARNRVMYGPPGHAYVYFTYGNHHMLNLVTETEGVAGAVLIRALEPVAGLEVMSTRRGGRAGPALTNGPGKLAAALGIDLTCNGVPLGESLAAYQGTGVPEERVGVSGRIGLSAGHELPLRFYVRDSDHVSKASAGPRSSGRGTRGKRGRRHETP